MIIIKIMNKYFYAIIIVFLIKTGNVFSYENIFNVDNIIIDIEKNKSREDLFNKAVKKAFKELAIKVLLEKDLEKISNLTLNEIKKLVSHYELNEEDSTKGQIIKFNITFDRDQINNYFFVKNILYADVSKLDIVIMPILIDNNNVNIFSNNYFYKNWQETEKNKNLNYINYILPIENIEDIELINKNKFNLELLEIDFLNKYDLKDYIYCVINYNARKSNIFLKSMISGNKIIKSFEIQHNNSEKLENFNQIKKTIKIEITELWKNQNLIDVKTPSFLNTKLDFKDKSDLLKVQKILSKIDLIQNYSVLELNLKYAKIKIKYLGKIEKLKKKFISEGLILNIIQGEINLKLI